MAPKALACACAMLMVAGAAAMAVTEAMETVVARGRTLAMAVSPHSDKPLYPADPAGNEGEILPDEHYSNGLHPQQIHLTVWGTPHEMLVSFVTGDPKVTPGAPTPADIPDVSHLRPLVRFGQSHTKYRTVTGHAVNYAFNNAWDFQPANKSMGYVSAPINHVVLDALKAGTTYVYQVAGGKNEPWSDWHTFTTAPKGFPVTVGVTADYGNTENGTETMLRMLGRRPSVVHILGDLSYADLYYPDGVWAGDDKKPGKYQTCYQQAWDQWARDMQPLFTTIPIMTTPGNHEIEFQPPTIGGPLFSSYNARYPMPQTMNPLNQTKPLTAVSNDTVLSAHNATNMYYAYTLPGVARMIFITSYIPSDHYTNMTAQFQWLEEELKKIDRHSTPWVVLHMHAPWYSSWSGSFKDTECMRLQYEPLIHEHKVDLVFNGHTHSYERFTPVYNDTKDDCGAVHVTVGMGGKPGNPPVGEGALDNEPIEKVTWAYCNSTALWKKKFLPKITLFGNSCPTIQHDLNNGSATNICWTAQPPFSAIRNAAYGMGTLEFISATQAKWRMYRNVDDEGTAFDEVTFDRSLPTSCAAAGRR